MRIAQKMLILGFVASLVGTSVAAERPKFREQVLDSAVCEVACYAVTMADVDGDKKSDIVAINERQVIWYRNPDWKKHVILEDQVERDHVCIAPYDIDGDGKVDFALGAGWTKIGTLQWITRDADESKKWHVHAIGREGWTHRMRWANVLGKKKQQLVVSPLNATQGNGVRLLAFEIPDDPKSGPWKGTPLDESFNRLHNHWHLDFNGDGVDGTLTASQEGIFLVTPDGSGGFRKRRVGAGMPGSKPEERGAGGGQVGKLPGGREFMTTVEPMHGTSLVVYYAERNLPEGQLAERHVIDDTLDQGHALWATDLDGDGGDEIVCGHRGPGRNGGKGQGVYAYFAKDGQGSQWEKVIVDDGGMAAEDLLCQDLNGDGRAEIVAGGRATKNLKIYWNEGKP